MAVCIYVFRMQSVFRDRSGSIYIDVKYIIMNVFGLNLYCSINTMQIYVLVLSQIMLMRAVF